MGYNTEVQDVFPSKKDSTVRIVWKLPARLRRPVGQQPKKKRVKKHAAPARIHFDRKKIQTKPEKNIALPPHRFFSSPVISSTADISRNQPLVPIRKPKPKKQVVHPLPPLTLIQERDIPYDFPPVRVVQPNVRIAIPSKNIAVGACILLFGCIVASFLIWNLQGAGRGTAVLSVIQEKSAAAFAHIGIAQKALADTNVIESEKQFSVASQELMSAKADMDEALAASKSVLQALDITGTVRSGQDMLDVGVYLADAGTHMSKALAPFLSVTLASSLTDAIIASRPDLEKVEQNLSAAEDIIADVETGLMPADIAANIDKLRAVIPQAQRTLRHLIEENGTFLALLGADRDRQYLVLFANSDELRPVGGFIGTVGLVNVARGKVENIDVRSVYDGDGQLKKFIAPPNPLLAIVNRWFLRDSNWFVDYRESASKAAQLFEKEGGPTVDGVMMLTPKVIQNLLAVTGPIQVPGYSKVVTADNFVEVTQGEVTYHYDRQLNKPKQFLSDLTPILLTRIFASSGEGENSRLKTLQAVTKSLTEKDFLLYFADKEAQEEAMRLGWAGALPQGAEGFLMVNNANVGGHKSDQFIEQEIDYRTVIAENGDADVVVTVRRTHHGPEEKLSFAYPAGEDPSQKDNIIYQRTLVPRTAQLLEAKGFTSESDVPRPVLRDASLQLEADADVVAWQQGQRRMADGTMVGTEAGYTFFANWVVTKPGQTSITLYHYRVPHAARMPNIVHSASSYAVSIAKQPGQRRGTVRASVELPSSVAIVRSFPVSGVTLESDTTFTYRGQLTSDIVPGIVFEKR